MDNKSQQVETAVWRLTNGRHRDHLEKEKEAAQVGDVGELQSQEAQQAGMMGRVTRAPLHRKQPCKFTWFRCIWSCACWWSTTAHESVGKPRPRGNRSASYVELH